MAELRIPHPSRDESLASLPDVLGVLDGDEREIVREVCTRLMADGEAQNCGDLLDHLEALGSAGRRVVVDQARLAVGMETIADEAARHRFEALNRGLRPGPDSAGRRLTSCAYVGCNVMPTTPGGALMPVADRVYWCPRHREHAGPLDHLPPEPKYVLNHNGSPKPVGAELERLQREDRKRRERWDREQEAKRKETKRLERLEAEHRRTLRPPAAWRG